MSRKVYTSGVINVSFDSSLCVHSANCLRGSPQVFDVDARPWIAADAAPADEIAAVVETCPSGALRYERLDGGPQEQGAEATTIRPLPNGPLMLRGRINIVDAEGAVIATETRALLCRCGGSANKPYCDNTHRRIGFTT